MISTDHFKYELLAQMRRAAARGRVDVLVTVDDLCASILRGHISSTACCDAMQAEIKTGDIVVLERSSAAGMAVRYLLPRAD